MNTMKPNDFEDRLDVALAQCDRTAPLPDAEFGSRLRSSVLEQTEVAPGVTRPEALRRACEMLTQPTESASQSNASPTPFDDSGRATKLRSKSQTSRSTKLRSFVRGLIAAGIAAVVLSAFWLRTPVSWAQVQQAMSAKPWIRLTTKQTDGLKVEFWLSIPQQKAAFQLGTFARYIDIPKDVQFDYEQSRGTVIRAPYRPIQSPQSWFEVFAAIMRGKEPNMDEFGLDRVLETRSRKVVEDGQEWLSVELTVQSDHIDPAMRMVHRMEFLVDPKTDLPHAMGGAVLVPSPNDTTNHQAHKDRFPTKIDYPAEGPADIYALGIPRDAKLDDRMPNEETARALKALTAGRRDFDSYLAIAFEATGSYEKPYDRLPTSIIWRRGNQVRAEVCWPFEPVPPYSEKPATIDDLTWWKQQLKHFRFLPAVVCDGKMSYTADFSLPDENGNQHVKAWKPLAKIRQGESLNELHISPARGNFPELAAYPPIEPTDATSLAFEPAPTPESPHGSLLTYRVTGQRLGGFDRSRYRLDPDRSYAVTQVTFDELDMPREKVLELNAPVEERYSMRNLQRSPKGFWYPTLVIREVVREPKVAGAPRELELVVSTSFLLDFTAAMPDSLFTKKERTAGF